MELKPGIELILVIIGVVPAIFFHLRRRGFLMDTALAAATSGWTTALFLAILSGFSWGDALLHGLWLVPPFFVLAAGIGWAVRRAQQLVGKRRRAREEKQTLAGKPEGDQGRA